LPVLPLFSILKKIINMKTPLVVLLLLITTASFAQRSKTADEYMARSKKLRTGAWILAGSGTAMLAGGTILLATADWEDDFNTDRETGQIVGGVLLIAGGVVCTLGSIPLFIISARDKHKAAMLSFKNEYAPGIIKNGLAYKQVPSLVLKINL
jgi:hypothetical protein